MAAKSVVLKDTEKYNRRNRRKRQWRRVVMVLAALVVFCTTYALILPAITMEKNCPIPEHTHSDACYVQQTTVEKQVPVCSAETLGVHQHTDDCYDADGILVCGYADFMVHTHDERCYREDGSLWCPLPEIKAHAHEDACSEQVIHVHTEDCSVLERGELLCDLDEETVQEDGSVHVHADSCYQWTETFVCGYSDTNQQLICEEEEIVLHTHQPYESAENPGCFDETGTTLICGFFEIREHQHTDACFETVEEPLDTTALTCADTSPEHEHTDRCYGVWTLACGLEEHTHGDECVAYTCGKTEHTHNEACYDAEGVLTCEMEEHTHTEACLQPSEPTEDERVAYVVALIDALPDNEVIGAKLDALEDDEEAYTAYYQEIYLQSLTAYAYYEDLDEALREQVTNRDKLFSLEWLYSAQTLEVKDSLEVYQVNQYKNAATTLVYGESVREKCGTGMGFTYWDALIIEKNSSGGLYVAQYVTADVSKLDYKASTSDGFILLLYNTTVNVAVGDYASVNFNYKSTTGYNANGYGTVTFGLQLKAEKDNGSKLSTVQGANTRDFIEINLYDYGDNINVLYNNNKNLPGFQQEYGSTDVKAATSGLPTSGSYNFGNNITSDLAAGINGVTNRSTAVGINKVTASANKPISSSETVMSSQLGSDGYPALADGTSLKYLFCENTYATKMNNRSVNGLFLYDSNAGMYSFNSRANHAQFNASDDTFTLYEQIISSNFMMYPFGNFLPFNDINKLSQQSSLINREYLLQIANTAQNKANIGGKNTATTEAYGKLATNLNTFVNLMDAKYPNGWTSAECINGYFSLSSDLQNIPAFTTESLSNIYTIDYDEETDFYFGMEMKMNFIQPRNGLTGSNGTTPMKFYFTGDDDVWVYIDGVLFMDLSGIHRHVGGEIDFQQGKVYYYALDTSTGDVSSTPYKTVTFAELLGSTDKLDENGRFRDYSSHTFNFYYMERGSGSSVCRMNFNFPLLQDRSISVSKELTVDSGDVDSLLGNPDFRFQVLKENGTDLFIKAGTPYEIYKGDVNTGRTGVVDENGVFTLKAGERAVFSGIKESAGNYYVRELLDPEFAGQYGKITVSGKATTTDYNVTVGSETFTGVKSPLYNVADGDTAFTFTNQADSSKLGNLSISKTLTDYTGSSGKQREFTFCVKLDGSPLPTGTPYTVGTETRYAAEGGLITLKADETAVISKIIAGTAFDVQEVGEVARNYVVAYSVNGAPQEGDSASGVVPLANQVALSVQNTELGASVSIPVQKSLVAPDGKERAYTILLEQTTSSDGNTPTDPAFSRELTFTIGTEPVEQSFEIGYGQSDYTNLPQTFYYKITEKENGDDAETIYDSTVYIVEVTLQTLDGKLDASVTKVWKEGTLLTEAENIAFVNRLVRYELPNTGGSGLTWFVLAGLALMSGAVAILFFQRRRRGKEGESSP